MSAEGRARRTAEADAVCREAFAQVAGSDTHGLALVAVGGYGRGELAPASDWDLILLHSDDRDPASVAERLWYPLWDTGAAIDHSVRSLAQVEESAASDVRVALGLLDARHVAGDDHLTVQLRTRMLADWRRQARTILPALKELTHSRHTRAGELAHLSVPDLKESEGGLRDAAVLKALVASWLVDVPAVDLERCRRELLDVRDAVHHHAGRGVDRINPEAWESVAEALGLPDALSAQRRVRGLGRRLAHLSRLTWRRLDAVLAKPRPTAARKPDLVTLAEHVVMAGGEVTVAASARPEDDPLLLLKAAALAAEHHMELSPVTAARLTRESGALPEPWPREALDWWLRLLGSGRGLLSVWETLDEVGAIERLIPEWDRIRLFPHASPIHRFTVDRHSIETVIEASQLIRQVSRPDVLLVAALLHDIGKGGTQPHSEAGEPLAHAIAVRLGMAPEYADTVSRLVRWHLLLSETATTRDPDDPATVAAVRACVHDRDELMLLAALTQADARAASPAAWTTWRAGLVERLVRHVAAELEGTGWEVEAPEVALPDNAEPGAVVLEERTGPAGPQILVAAQDRVGLLADIAGALLLSRHSVREARVWSQGSWGCSLWEIGEADANLALVRQRLSSIVAGTLDVGARLSAAAPGAPAPSVRIVRGVAAEGVVVEVRAHDRLGVLYRACRVLADHGWSITSAHADTVGPAAMDVFYVQHLTGEEGSESTDVLQAALEEVLR